MELCAMCSVPMSLKVALTFNVFGIMDKSLKPMSVQEIVKKMPPSSSLNYGILDRMMKLLASYHVFDRREENPTRYMLTAIGKALVYVNQDKVCMDAWQLLHKVVTDGDVELSVMENPQVGSKLHIDSIDSTAILFMKDLLASSYTGFEGVNVLVDIGGGTGKSLSMIVAKYTTIKGINFDFPDVIRGAPRHPRVENKEGNMLESVPDGDTMLLNCVLHNREDEQCKKILRNCYKNVGKKGKVIVIDLLPNKTYASADCRAALKLDLHMMAFFRAAKERSLNDLGKVAEAAGFKSVKLAHQLDVLLSVVELSN